MANPLPLPTAIKELNGNPGKRPLNHNEPKPRPVAPKMPRGLSPKARRFWKDHAAVLERFGLFTEADGATFELMANHYAIAKEAAEVIKREGIMREDDRGVQRKHPMLQVLRDNSNAYRQYAAHFGLTPASRSRLSIPEPEDEGFDFGF